MIAGQFGGARKFAWPAWRSGGGTEEEEVSSGD